MKKKLEAELISIAHRILKLKGKEDINKMYDEVKLLQEKLAVLKFAEENFEDQMPTIGSDSSFFGMLDKAFNNTITDTIEVDNKVYVNMDEKPHNTVAEPGIETIKDIVSQMPHEAQRVDELINQPTQYKNDVEDIAGDYQTIPVFEPITHQEPQKKSLNDKLKSGELHIDLNDKLAFIKHLFNGKTEEYERVTSQLNTFNTLGEAQHFIHNIVKPDYNNWEDKDTYVERLLIILEKRFS